MVAVGPPEAVAKSKLSRTAPHLMPYVSTVRERSWPEFLEAAGVSITICQTCLDHYGLIDKVAVGRIGGMDAIVSLITTADEVITP